MHIFVYTLYILFIYIHAHTHIYLYIKTVSLTLLAEEGDLKKESKCRKKMFLVNKTDAWKKLIANAKFRGGWKESIMFLPLNESSTCQTVVFTLLLFFCGKTARRLQVCSVCYTLFISRRNILTLFSVSVFPWVTQPGNNVHSSPLFFMGCNFRTECQ